MKRIPPKRETAVPIRVAELLDRFEYPELPSRVPFQLGETGGTPTVVVAASTATDISKSKADMVCTGVNDQDVIQQACDLTTSEGGEVWLTEGRYTTSGPITLSNQTALRGLGVAASEIIGSSSTALIVAGATTRISDLYLENTNLSSGNAINVAGSLCVVERCNLWSRVVGNALQKTGGGSLLVYGCWIQGDGDGIVTDVGDGDYLTVSDTLFESCETAIHIVGAGSGSAFISIAGNIFDNNESYAIRLESAQLSQIVGNSFVSNGQGVGSWAAISVDQNTVQTSIVGNTFNSTDNGPDIYIAGDRTVVVGNVSQNALHESIHVDGAQLCQVADNNIFEPHHHGIVVEGTDNVVVGNLVHAAGSDTTDTFDNYQINGDDNQVVGNKSVPSTGAHDTRYGINIAGGNNNAAYANYLGDASAYGTADFVDSGTGTITAPDANGQFTY